MLQRLKMLIASRIPILDPVRVVGGQSIRDQLWPHDGNRGHPWALLYDDPAKKEIASETMQRVTAISAAGDKTRANREWIIECVLLLAEFGVMVVAKSTSANSDVIEGYPGVTGELEPHLDELISLKHPKLLQAADSALAGGLSLPSKLMDRKAVVRELLATRLNRGQFNLQVANAIRVELGDMGADVDWLSPFQYSLMTWFEDSYRKALGMAPVVAPFEALRHSLFMNIVDSGARDPYAAWLEAKTQVR